MLSRATYLFSNICKWNKLWKASTIAIKRVGLKDYRLVGRRGFRQKGRAFPYQSNWFGNRLCQQCRRDLSNPRRSQCCSSGCSMNIILFVAWNSCEEAFEWTNGSKIESSGYSVARCRCYQGGKHWCRKHIFLESIKISIFSSHLFIIWHFFKVYYNIEFSLQRQFFA